MSSWSGFGMGGYGGGPSVPPAAALYRFDGDGNAGTLIDYSGNALTPTAGSDTYAAGHDGLALGGGAGSIPPGSVFVGKTLPTGSFSLGCWLLANAGEPGVTSVSVRDVGDIGPVIDIAYGVNFPDVLTVSFEAGAQELDGPSMPQGFWFLVVVVVDGGNATLYIDGVAVGTLDISSRTETLGGTVNIVASGDLLVDDAFFTESALTAEQVAALLTTPYPGGPVSGVLTAGDAAWLQQSFTAVITGSVPMAADGITIDYGAGAGPVNLDAAYWAGATFTHTYDSAGEYTVTLYRGGTALDTVAVSVDVAPAAAALYRFAGDDGSLIDSAGNGLKLVGGTPSYRAGSFDLALDNGTFTATGVGPLGGQSVQSGSFAVGCWVYIGPDHDDTQTVMKIDWLDNDESVAIKISGTGEVQVHVQAGNVVVNAGVVDAETWHHVVAVFDSGSVTVYVDGEVAGTADVSGLNSEPNGPVVVNATTNDFAVDDVFATAASPLLTAGHVAYLQTNPYPAGSPSAVLFEVASTTDLTAYFNIELTGDVYEVAVDYGDGSGQIPIASTLWDGSGQLECTYAEGGEYTVTLYINGNSFSPIPVTVTPPATAPATALAGWTFKNTLLDMAGAGGRHDFAASPGSPDPTYAAGPFPAVGALQTFTHADDWFNTRVFPGSLYGPGPLAGQTIGSGTFSIGFWLKVGTGSTVGGTLLAVALTGADNAYAIHFFRGDTPSDSLAVQLGITPTTVASLPYLKDGTWHHYALVVTGGNATVYADGVAGAPVDVSAITDTVGGYLYIYNPTSDSDELIADLFVSGVAWTQENINYLQLNPHPLGSIPPTASMLFTFDGDGSTGAKIDGSGNSTPPALSPSGTPGYDTGQFGLALAGDWQASSSSSPLGNPGLAPADGSFSVGFWFRTSTSAEISSPLILNNSALTAPGLAFWYGQVTANVLDVYFDNLTVRMPGPTITENTWTQITIVVSGGSATIYKDGVAGTPFDVSATTENVAGTLSLHTGFGSQQLDDVFVVNTALPAEHVAGLAASAYPPNDPVVSFTWSQPNQAARDVEVVVSTGGNVRTLSVDWNDAVVDGVAPADWDGGTLYKTYAAAGVYAVTLTANAGDPDETVFADNVTVGIAPAAGYSIVPGGPFYIGENQTFIDTTTGDYSQAENVWEYSWNAGLNWSGYGSTGDASIDLDWAAFSGPGDYLIRLSVSGFGGSSQYDAGALTVYAPVDMTILTTNPVAADWETGVQGSASAGGFSGGDASYTVTYDWGEGGGFVSDDTHTYATAGSYTLTARVTDGNGRFDEMSTGITVTDP